LIFFKLEIIYVTDNITLENIYQLSQEKLINSFKRIFSIITLNPNLFGKQSYWFFVTLLVSILFSIFNPLFKKKYNSLYNSFLILIGIFFFIYIAELVSKANVPIRSLIYLPIGLSIIVLNAYNLVGKFGKNILLIIVFITIINNAAINNHLFLISTITEQKDKLLANEIIKKVNQFDFHNGNKISKYKLEIIGSHSWSKNKINFRSEHLGGSFFEWDGGNPYRVSNYLKFYGLNVVAASSKDRKEIYENRNSFYSWPSEGWVSFYKDIIVVKFGEYSYAQKLSLCKLDVRELC
jgi:hypothetical protein